MCTEKKVEKDASGDPDFCLPSYKTAGDGDFANGACH